MPLFKIKIMALAKECGAHKVHKLANDERIAMTPEDLCEFALSVIANQKEFLDAAKRDCFNPRQYRTYVRGWWDRYCRPETEDEIIRRVEMGTPGAASGKAAGD